MILKIMCIYSTCRIKNPVDLILADIIILISKDFINS